MAIAILFATGLTSVAFAGERRGLAVTDDDAGPMMYAGGCVGCGRLSDAVPSLYSDGTPSGGYFVGPYAYANPENDAVTRSYYGDPTPRAHVVHRTIKPRQVSGRSHRHAVELRTKTSHHQAKRPVARVKKLARRAPPPAGNVRVASTFAALPAIVTLGPPALNAVPVSGRSVPNVVVVKGQQVEIVSPDQVNSIDLAADAPIPDQAEDQAGPLAGSASPTLLAQALSVIAGALAALSVGLFLIGRSAVRISTADLERNDGRRRQPGSQPLEPAHVALLPATPASMLAAPVKS